MMFDFDMLMSSWCEERDLVYMRYADDLFVSSDKPNMLSEALRRIADCALGYRFALLKINREKTAFLSRRYRRSITGIIVTPTHGLSIGRDRKLCLKSNVYEYQQGRLSLEQMARVRGMLAFVRDVEPTFYSTLTRKYGKGDN
jgi:RNA-directed DNA polymerase